MRRGEYLGEFEEIVLLAAARLGEAAYGMAVRREIEQRTGREASIGAVYTTLDRLAQKGLLRATARVPEPGRDRRARHFFLISADGRAALEDARRARLRLQGRRAAHSES